MTKDIRESSYVAMLYLILDMIRNDLYNKL